MASRSKSFLLILFAVVLGLGAAVLAQRWVQANTRTAEATPEDGMTVVVAARDIEFGNRLVEADVRTVAWPADSLPDGAYHDTADVVGRASISQIAAGEPILARRIANADANALLSTRIGDRKRAITVRVDDVVGVAGFLLPGSRVDVLASRRKDNSGYRYETRTVLQDLRVLAVDQTANPEDKDKPLVVRAVTLEVAPEEAEKLVTSTREGSVQLTLRNPADDAELKLADNEPKAPVRRAVRSTPGNDVTVVRGTWVGTTRTSK